MAYEDPIQDLDSDEFGEDDYLSRWSSMDMEDMILSEINSFWEEEKVAKDRRDKASHKARLFYIGDQLVMDDFQTGWPEPLALDAEEGELYWMDDQFSPMIDSNVKEFVKVRPAFDYESISGQADDQRIALVAGAIVEHYQPRLLHSDFLQAESKRSILDGDAFRFLDYVDNMGQPIYSPDEEPVLLSPGGMECLDCGHTFAPEEGMPDQPAGEDLEMELAPDGVMGAPQCPNCGSQNITETEPVMSEGGGAPRRQGEFILDGVDSDQICTNSWASGGLDEAVWLRRERWLDRAVAHSMHPNAKMSQAYSQWSWERSEERRRRLQQNFGGTNQEINHAPWTGSGSERQVPYLEDWLDPVVYAGYKTRREETIPGTDKTIPEGTLLSDVFPAGLKVCRIGEKIVGLYNQDFHKHWVHFRNKAVPGRFWGTGAASALPLQEWLNELVSLVMTFLIEVGSPTRVYDGRVFPQGIGVAGRPSLMIEASNKPTDVSMDNVFRIFPPGTLSDGVYLMFQKIKEEMQAHLGAYSTMSGLPDAASNTATGMSLVQEQAQSLMAVALQLRAQADAKTMELLLELFRNNVDDERAFKIGGEYSRGPVRMFKGADLETSVVLTVRDGSQFPRQQYQRRNDIVEYWNTKAMIMQAKGRMDVAEERLLAERFNVPEVISKALKGTESAKTVLDKLRAEAERLESDDVAPEEEELITEEVMMLAAEDPSIPPAMAVNTVLAQKLLSIVPVRRYSDYHIEMVEFWREWMNTDEGRECGEVLTEALESLMEGHMAAQREVDMLMQGGPSPDEMALMAEMGAMPPAGPSGNISNPGGKPPTRPSLPKLGQQKVTR